MINLRMGVRLVEVERSGVVESVHTGHVVILGPDGSTLLSLGEPNQPVFARSCLKPLQATAMLQAGFDGSVDEIALAAASHSGSALHLNLIESSLTSAGLSAADLGCPADLPIGEAERSAYLKAGSGPSRLAMNCSGKHAAMLRTCLVNGWEIADYLNPAHPLQATIRNTVIELTGEQIAATGVDGCGAPVLAVSLAGLARAFSHIARSSGLSPSGRVAEAMRAYPELVGGVGRLNTRLMQSVPGLIAKDGAEGCFAAALTDGGSVAVKIDDGGSRAAEVAVVAALSQLGVADAATEAMATLPVLGAGNRVGSVRPTF